MPKSESQFSFEYFNTSSSKCLYDILKQIAGLKVAGSEVEINWFYEDYDDDMRETGKTMKMPLGWNSIIFPWRTLIGRDSVGNRQ